MLHAGKACALGGSAVSFGPTVSGYSWWPLGVLLSQSQHTQGQSTSSDIRRLLCSDPESCSCPRQTRAQAACLPQGLPLTVASPASPPPPVFLVLPFSYSRHNSALLSWGQAQLLTSLPASTPVVLSLPTVLTLAGFLSEMGHIRSYGLSPVPFRIQPLLAKVRLVMDDRQLTK